MIILLFDFDISYGNISYYILNYCSRYSSKVPFNAFVGEIPILTCFQFIR